MDSLMWVFLTIVAFFGAVFVFSLMRGVMIGIRRAHARAKGLASASASILARDRALAEGKSLDQALAEAKNQTKSRKENPGPVIPEKKLRATTKNKKTTNKKKRTTKNKGVTSVNAQSSNSDEKEFSSIAQFVQMHMFGAGIPFQEQLSKMSKEQEKKYLAFELGVIEQIFHTMLWLEQGEDTVRLFNFLIFYDNYKYPNSAQFAFHSWRKLLVDGQNFTERKLGFDSVNDEVKADGTRREGHYPPSYLKDALGIEL